MKLSFEKIKEFVTGAVRMEEENGSLRLYRFTREQEKLYRVTSENFYNKTFANAGGRLMFRTDSETLGLKGEIFAASSRKYFSIDVFADGKPVGYIDNFSGLELPQDYTKIDVEYGAFCEEVALGGGTKTVCIYLPWSAYVALEALTLDDGAVAEAVKPAKKLLAYGDSITQGYDALRPSNRYVAKLADLLDAEEVNKGIGGEKFFPALGALKDDYEPDYITVAYGTNDWSRKDAETFLADCRDFYTNLSRNYPQVPIFAITPIWRKVTNEVKMAGSFEDLERLIRLAVAELPNVTVISGTDFVPKDINYFADLRLHPNDEGFAHYAENLYNAIKKELK